MRSPSIRTSACTVAAAVTTVPLRISVSGMRAHLPGLSRLSSLDLLHRDAVLHRAHQPAQIAAHALLFIYPRDAMRRRRAGRELRHVELGDRRGYDARARPRLHGGRRRVPLQMNALMGAVPTSHVAEIAADAFIAVDP